MTTVLTYNYNSNSTFANLEDPLSFEPLETAFLNKVVYEVETESISSRLDNLTFTLGTKVISLAASFPTLTDYITDINTRINATFQGTAHPSISIRLGNFYLVQEPGAIVPIIFTSLAAAYCFGFSELTPTLTSTTRIYPNPRLSATFVLNIGSDSSVILPTAGSGEVVTTAFETPIITRVPRTISIENRMTVNGENVGETITYRIPKKIYLEFSTSSIS